MSASANKIGLEVDEVIRRRHDLMTAIDAATHFFEEGMDFAGIDSQSINPELYWTLNTDHTIVQVEYKERTNGLLNMVMRNFPLSHLFDEVNRRTWMLRLLRDVNGMRYYRVMQRYEKMIEELEEAESNGH